MPLYNDNIKNYFRPFATAPSLKKKRPLLEEDQDQPTGKRSPLNSPSENQTCLSEEQSLSANDSLGNAFGDDESLWSSRRLQPTSSRPAESDKIPSISSSDEPVARDVTEASALVPLQDETGGRATAFSSSQSILTSSQRIVKNGEVMIRNSDDESDSSLEDLDDLIARNSTHKAPSPPACNFDDSFSNIQAGKHAESVKKQTTGTSAQLGKPASPHLLALPVIPKQLKFSLESLAKERKQHDAGKESVAQALSLIESYDQRKASSNEKSRTLDQKGTLDVDLVTRLVKTEADGDNVSRLQAAIRRTEALQYSQSWSFFEDHPGHSLRHRAGFPAIEDQRLKPVLDESVSRHQAFLSGYVGEYATKASLPEELLLWIVDEICFEMRDDLRYAYINTLKYATVQLSPLITHEHIDRLFQKLGATATAINIKQPVVPRAVPSQNIEHVSRPCLLSILDLLRGIAGSLAVQCRTHIFCLLCRLSLDQSIVKDFHAIDAIGGLLLKLADLYPEEDNDLEVRSRAMVETS